MNKAVVLLSGGLDSTTVLGIARARNYELYGLSFDYGQRHQTELIAARRVADAMGAAHRVLELDLRAFGHSALTDEIDVPKHDDASQVDTSVIPVTYVPARNTIFLAYALAYAEVQEADDIFVGVNALDYSGYPDCRPEYVDAFEHLANLATKRAVDPDMPEMRINAPLIHWTKNQIIAEGLKLGVPYELTHSCYDPTPDPDNDRVLACGRCDSCLLRLRGFAENGAEDPIAYVE